MCDCPCHDHDAVGSHGERECWCKNPHVCVYDKSGTCTDPNRDWCVKCKACTVWNGEFCSVCGHEWGGEEL